MGLELATDRQPPIMSQGALPTVPRRINWIEKQRKEYVLKCLDQYTIKVTIQLVFRLLKTYLNTTLVHGLVLVMSDSL